MDISDNRPIVVLIPEQRLNKLILRKQSRHQEFKPIGNLSYGPRVGVSKTRLTLSHVEPVTLKNFEAST